MFCQQCGNSNDISAKFCPACGLTLPQFDQVEPAVQKRVEGSENLEFYEAVIGPKNQSYYSRHFQNFDREGRARVSWHWPAFFMTFYWLLYRKMWLYALIYFVSPYIFLIPIAAIGAMAGASSDTVTGFLYLVYLAGVLLLPPLYANALYYKSCKNKIVQAKASSRDVQRQFGELSGRGGTSGIVLVIVFIFAFVAIIGILAAVAIPAYQDYTTRARVAEAASIGNVAAESVTNYYSQHQTVPDGLDEAGFAALLPLSVKKLDIDGQNGVVIVIMATAPIEGKALLLVPSLDENGQITWKCMSQEIPGKYLPSQCRQQQ